LTHPLIFELINSSIINSIKSRKKYLAKYIIYGLRAKYIIYTLIAKYIIYTLIAKYIICTQLAVCFQLEEKTREVGGG